MKNRLLCLATILAFTVPLGPGSIFPIGPSFFGSIGQNYYVATAGSDSNACTQALPCQTIAHINILGFAPADCVNFNGGDTFTGGVNATGLTCIKSYGAGKATISSGNSTACYVAINLPAVVVTNIICTGGGNLTNSTAGISIVNSQGGNTKLAGPTISGNVISGYGYNGISIQGSNGSSGFNGITITNNTVHDVTGNSIDSFGTSCIMVFSKTGYGLGATTPSHTNITIRGNTVSNCTGTTSASTNWTGSGIFVAQSGGSIAIGGSPSGANVAHDFGGSNGSAFEPVGIWVADGAPSSCVISYNEAYNGLSGTNAAPAHSDGFAIDGGVTGCVGEHNKSHDNAGLGWLLENYSDGTCCAVWGNNTVRFNLDQNNLNKFATQQGDIGFHFPAAATGPAFVYNNTITNQNGTCPIGDSPSSTGAVTVTIANNIFAVNNGGSLVCFTNNTGTTTFNVNDYYTYGTAAKFTWNGTTYSNASVATAFAAWQTATGQEKISGVNVGLTSNPQIYVPGGLFVSNGYAPTFDMASNLQTGSPMIGAGLNLQTQFGINPGATDYYGTAISAASLPVGAANGDFATFTASCSQASNFLARVSSYTKLDNVNENSLDCGFNADGIWSGLDLLYMLASPNSAASLLNRTSTSFSLVSHGTTTFTARQGIAGNGVNGSYLDTQWVPSTNGVNYTLSSVTHLGYQLTDGLANTAGVYGTQNSTGTAEASNFPGTGGWYADANDVNGATATGTTTSKGSFLLNRTGSTLTEFFNGANIHSAFPAPVALPNQNMVLLCFNAGTGSGVVANQCSSGQVSAALFGSGGIDPIGTSRRINSFMQAYGINTY